MTWATVYESMFKSNDSTCYSNQKQYSSICKCRLPQSQQTRLSIRYLRRDLRNKAYKPTSFYWRIVVKLGAPAWNVSTRRNGRDPPRDPRRFWSRPRRDPRRRGPRPRRWAFWSRRDRDETLIRLETVSRPRRRDRDHIPETWLLL